jgi:acyl-CoA thioester hydrolase
MATSSTSAKMSATSYPFHLTLAVTFRDLDVLGHVNHAVYFTYMETARTNFFVDLLQLASPQGLPVILAEATCSYQAPLFFGEQVVVGVGISRFGGKSFDMVYRIDGGDGRLAAVGKTIMVMYDYGAGQTIPVPDDLKARVHAFQGQWQAPT